MAVRSFLNPYGALVDGLERGGEFAFRQASQAQAIRDNEDEYVARLLRRPAEQALLENQARASGFNANFLGDTYNDRVKTTGYNTEQERIRAIADQLKYDYEKAVTPYNVRSAEANSRIVGSNADVAEQTVDPRIKAAQLNPMAIQANINATGASTGYTGLRSQDLQNDIVQEEIDRQADIVATAAPTALPNGMVRLMTVNGVVDMSEDQYIQTLEYVRDKQTRLINQRQRQTDEEIDYDAPYP